jgi:hypothetical protein
MKLVIDTDKRTAEVMCNILWNEVEVFAKNPELLGDDDTIEVLKGLKKIVEGLEEQIGTGAKLS